MTGTRSAKSGRKPESRRDYFVPRVEGLEERLVPVGSAIRVLPGITTQILAKGNEESALAHLGFGINFYGTQTNSLYVNTDGNVTLSAPLNVFTLFASRIPTSLGQGIIAPFYADVDNTTAAAAGNLEQISYGAGTFAGHQIFEVTWLQVGYFNDHATPVDSFQLVLISRPDTGPGNFDIEFNYGDIGWDSADSQGGTNGKAAGTVNGFGSSVGFAGGSGQPGTFFILPNSSTHLADPFINGNGATSLLQYSFQANTTGRQHYYIRNGVLSNGTTDVTSLTNVYAPFLYTYNPFNQTYTGNLTLVNRSFQLQSLIQTQQALDELPVLGQSGNPPTTTLTIVLPKLPAGVALLNATGTTASGQLYIQLKNVPFGAGNTIRIPLVFKNPLRQALIDFFDTAGFHLFAGAFDPTQD